MILGRHGVFSQNSLHSTFAYAKDWNINATQIFVKPPQQWTGRDFTTQELDRWYNARTDIFVCAHTGYFINIAAGEQKSLFSLLHEARRCSKLGISHLVVHPGSSLGNSLAQGIATAITSLRALESRWPQDVTLLLENMAGQGKMLSSLSTLKEVIAGVQGIPLGVCYDTAHAHGYGVDLTTTEEIYYPIIKLFHINDSEKAFASKKDRHASLGTGTIPLSAFKRIAQIKGTPFIMETPLGNEQYDLEVFRALV